MVLHNGHPYDAPASYAALVPLQDSSDRLSELGAALLADLDARGVEVARAVRERLAFYRESAVVPEADLVESCTANLRFAFEAVARQEAADPAPAADTGNRRAASEVPLSAVLAAYRIGFHHIWQQVVEQGKALGLSAEELLLATSQAMAAHDLYSDHMTTAYNDALAVRIRNHEAERSALAEAVLTGTLTDRRTLWEAADLLGLPHAGPYVVAAVQLTRPGRLALPRVEAALAAQRVPSAWRLLPELQVGILAGPPERVEEQLAHVAASARARVAVSPPFDDLTGAGQALEWARLTVASSPPGVGVFRFDENPVGIAAAAAPDLMRRVAGGVLAPLQELPEAERDVLLGTLRAWVGASGSTARTASRLHCHQNTVRHRLRRVEDLIGRRLDAPSDVAAVCLALEVVRDETGTQTT